MNVIKWCIPTDNHVHVAGFSTVLLQRRIWGGGGGALGGSAVSVSRMNTRMGVVAKKFRATVADPGIF